MIKKPTTGILFIDESSFDGYLHLFIKRNHANLFSSTIIITIGSNTMQAEAEEKGMHYLYLSYPNSNNFDIISEIDCLQFGKRVVNLLTINEIIKTNEDFVFLFHNSSLYFIATALRRRLKTRIVTFIDEIQWRRFKPKKVNNQKREFFPFDDKRSKYDNNRKYFSRKEDIICNTSDLMLVSQEKLMSAIFILYNLAKKRIYLWHHSVFDDSHAIEPDYKNMIKD